MTDGEVLEVAPVHPVAARLHGAGINEIVVIDDSFDTPDLAHVGSVDQFWSAVKGDPEATAELQGIGEVSEAADIDDALIEKLWELRGGPLAAHASAHLFTVQHEQQKDVRALCAHLESIGLKPKERGARDESSIEAQLIFLDYVLDSRLTEKRAEIATRLARKIYKDAPDTAKPFIVLMSDKEDAESESDDFRKESELIAGLFGFLTKKEVASKETLLFRLVTWGVGNNALEALQRFVSSVVASVNEAAKSFSRDVMSLEVPDYSFIQKLSLHKDGHPLGDYLMWLFESALGHALRNDDRVKAAQAKLDRTSFDRIIPCQKVPSDRLAQFYFSAVTEPAVAALQAQPFDPEGKLPDLFLGDVFHKPGDPTVLMVLTAACDLMLRPSKADKEENAKAATRENPGTKGEKPEDAAASKAPQTGGEGTVDGKPRAKKAERVPPPKPGFEMQPVYLAPGRLVAIEDREPEHERACTELIYLNQKPHRIDWDTKHVESKRLGKIWSELTQDGYERKWRLRLPYALEVQQEFASHVTRVGLPVAPPLVEQADVDVFISKNGKAVRSGDRLEGGAVLMNGAAGTEVVLTRVCVEELIARAETVALNALDAVAAVPDGPKQQERQDALRNLATKLRTLRQEPLEWAALLERPFRLPPHRAKDKTVVSAKLLWATFEAEVEGVDMKPQPIFGINIVVPTASAGDEASDEQGTKAGQTDGERTDGAADEMAAEAGSKTAVVINEEAKD